MRPHLHLVSPKVDQELVDELTKLRDAAARGEIDGIAYVCLGRGNGFGGDVLGRIRHHRLLARGIVDELHDMLIHLPRKPHRPKP